MAYYNGTSVHNTSAVYVLDQSSNKMEYAVGYISGILFVITLIAMCLQLLSKRLETRAIQALSVFTDRSNNDTESTLETIAK